MDKQYKPELFEDKIYQMWEKSGAFAPAKKGKPYCIIMPPPNANASLHAGHGMYTVDDVLIRFKRMQGFSASWLPGTDHAGFETQYVYEKELREQGRSRMDFDRKTLYENIFKFVKQNSGLIYQQFKRLGFSADWEKSVFSLDKQVVDFVIKTFNKMVDEGLVYRGNYMVNYCTHCGTSLAELEVKHRERIDPLYYIKYGPFTLATVRPETKFGDTAVGINPKDKRYKKWAGKEIEVKGLLGKFKLKVVADNYIDKDFGTGVVKITPAHDPNDWEIGKRHNLEIKRIIDINGRLTGVTGKYAGLKVNKARELVVEDLKKAGLLVKVDDKYRHSVTVCYKCGRDLEPTIIPNWFVKVDPLKPAVVKAIKANKTKFYPARFKKQILNWMGMMDDWPISRQITWGIRIPAWYSVEQNPDLEVVFLNKHKKSVSGKIKDLLKKYSLLEIELGLQKLTASNDAGFKISQEKPGENYLQETDVFDTWFSSGQWPLVILGAGQKLPTDVMGTLADILRFWVSRMMMFALYLKKEIPFKEVYLWSMVADAKGVKMSKSKGNVINPIELVDKYGADALRMALLFGTGPGSKVILADDKVRAMRNLTNKIWNAARFVIEFLEESSSPGEKDQEFKNSLNECVKITTERLEKYRLGQAAEKIYEWFWHVYCDQYVELAKKGLVNKRLMIEGLKVCLKLLHPFVPFVTEAVWQQLPESKEKLLINSSWPK